jgi:dihydroneopterin aldolase
MKVGLKDITIRCNTAFFDWERELGVDLVFNIMVELKTEPKNLEDSVDYVKIYELLQKQAKVGYKLIETLAQDIGSHIMDNHPAAKGVHIIINKPFLPISGYRGGGSVIEYSCGQIDPNS